MSAHKFRSRLSIFTRTRQQSHKKQSTFRLYEVHLNATRSLSDFLFSVLQLQEKLMLLTGGGGYLDDVFLPGVGVGDDVGGAVRELHLPAEDSRGSVQIRERRAGLTAE